MTLFLRTELHKNTARDGGVYLGALFFCCNDDYVQWILRTCPQYYEASSLYKQRDFLFFLAWAYALPTWILKIPITLVEVCIWVCMTHYVVGFDAVSGR
uniref:ATP-binding cassette transporter n=2 Tax=Solanum tuberosum TaxID=4113 RepID=M1CTL5_SOLTU